MNYNPLTMWEPFENSSFANNTIISLWGDHGWHLGEKEHWRKMTLWEQGTRVPLIVKMPKMAKGKMINDPVSLQDIYPSLVDLCQLDLSQDLDGRLWKHSLAYFSFHFWNSRRTSAELA